MDVALDILVRGALTSGVLALLALGFSLAYGVGGIVNLAHGSLYMVGAYAAVSAATSFGWSPIPAAAFGVIAAGTMGVVVHALVIRPIRDQPIPVLIVTLAAATFLAAAVRFFFGTANRGLTGIVSGSTNVFGVTVQTTRLLAFGVGVVVVAAVLIVLRRTPAGRIVRAVAQDPEAATLMGIDTGRVLMVVMGIGGALAGLAGVMVAPFEVVFPDMWLGPLTQAFAIVILGGLGSIEGTVLAATLLGFIDRAVAFGLPNGERFLGLISVVVILGTLLIRPQGILGQEATH